jgi:enoyl-CoA hydratase/carnithine racemase
MLEFKYIQTRIKNKDIFHIIIKRPSHYNALNKELSKELINALKYADDSKTIKCIIVSGIDNFCVGADISELSTEPHFIEIWDYVDKIKKPIIASVSGLALGGGLEILLMCDIILAAKNSKFGQPEINLGLIPGGGATQRLPRVIGKNKAMEICLTGDTISAQEAKDIGIINQICDENTLMPLAENIAEKIATKSMESITTIKKLIKQSYNRKIEDGIRKEKISFYKIIKGKNGVEGITAFMEKRKPKFYD